MSLLDAIFAPKPVFAPTPEPPVIVGQLVAERRAPSTVGLDVMVAAFNASIDRGFGEREAMADALDALAESNVVTAKGKGAKRVCAKARRWLRRIADRARYEAFFGEGA